MPRITQYEMATGAKDSVENPQHDPLTPQVNRILGGAADYEWECELKRNAQERWFYAWYLKLGRLIQSLQLARESREEATPIGQRSLFNDNIAA